VVDLDARLDHDEKATTESAHGIYVEGRHVVVCNHGYGIDTQTSWLHIEVLIKSPGALSAVTTTLSIR